MVVLRQTVNLFRKVNIVGSTPTPSTRIYNYIGLQSMSNKWISIHEKKPDSSYINIIVKTKDGKVGFAYYKRHLPKEFGNIDLPRKEFLEKCEQVFTGIPVKDIDDISILKQYNPDDIEYWMSLEDAADKEKWRTIDFPSDRSHREDVLILKSDGEISVGRMIIYREMALITTRPENVPAARGKKYKVFHSKYCGSYENLMFLARENNVVSWQYLPE